MALSNAQRQKKFRDKKALTDKKEIRRYVKSANFDKCNKAIDKIEADKASKKGV